MRLAERHIGPRGVDHQHFDGSCELVSKRTVVAGFPSVAKRHLKPLKDPETALDLTVSQVVGSSHIVDDHSHEQRRLDDGSAGEKSTLTRGPTSGRRD